MERAVINGDLKTLLFIAYLWYCAEGLFTPIYAIFAESIGGDILEVVAAYAVYQITNGILHIIFGRIFDKMKSQELMMLAGYAINTVATFFLVLVTTTARLFSSKSCSASRRPLHRHHGMHSTRKASRVVMKENNGDIQKVQKFAGAFPCLLVAMSSSNLDGHPSSSSWARSRRSRREQLPGPRKRQWPVQRCLPFHRYNGG